MNTLTLSVKDRFLLLPVLPQFGGRIEMMVVKSLVEKITFSAEEVAEFKLVDLPNGGLQGDHRFFRDVTILLTEEQIRILKPIPERLDKEKKITLDLMPVLDRIDQLGTDQ